MKKRKRTPREQTAPFDLLAHDEGPVSPIIYKFLKYHREWRLYVGACHAKKLDMDPVELARLDRLRIKYYAKVYGIEPAQLYENVYMHDSPGGGGNRERQAALMELGLPQSNEDILRDALDGNLRAAKRLSRLARTLITTNSQRRQKHAGRSRA